MYSFCLYFVWGCQYCVPELLFWGILSPTLIDLPVKDSPQVLNRVEVMGWWWPHHDVSSHYSHNNQGVSGVFCSMGWCFAWKLFCSGRHNSSLWQEMVCKEHILRNKFWHPQWPKGPYHLISQYSSPRHHSATSLLTLQSCWNRVAIYQPSRTPSIWTI